MKKHRMGGLGRGLLKITLAFAAAGAAHAQTGVTLTDALIQGQVSLNVRYRFAFITQDNPLEDAKASTVRTRLGYRTKDFRGIGAFIQFSDTRVAAVGDYNSSTNGQLGYATEPDPKLTQVSQAYLALSAAPGNRVRMGRQRLIFDNARFVGNVGWRQNQQTFDSVSFSDAPLPDLHFVYAYLYNVNTVTGAQAGMHSHLVNVRYRHGQIHGVAYAYLIDFDQAPASASKTLGLRVTGERRLSRIKGKFIYTAEYANQSPYRGGDSGIGANYYLGEVGAAFTDKTLKLSYEVLGGGDFAGFDTPLATKHAFNGWADQFLTTPKDGLRDAFITVALHPKAFRAMAVYHHFSAQRGGAHYGDEFDLQLARRFGDHYTLLAEYARYRAATFGVNTDKLWVQGVAAF